MKLLIVLAAAAVCAQALPAQVGDKAGTSEAYNATLFAAHSETAFGFASAEGGTRGGAGGAVWTVWDPWALRDAVRGDDPRIIHIRGRIDLTPLFEDSPGVLLEVGSFKTIMGGDSDAMIFGGGLRLYKVGQVIIRNIKWHNCLSYGPGEYPDGSGGVANQQPGEFTIVDCVQMETAHHVWVDHNEFADDPYIADGIPNEDMRHDGLVDMTHGSNWITVSNNIFRNHNKNILCGHDDQNGDQDTGKLKASFVRNWFMGTTQRSPRVRFGEAHVLNNLYTDTGSYGIGPGSGSSVIAEKNVFINTQRSWGFPAGIPDPMSNLADKDNLFINSRYDEIPSDVRWDPTDYYEYQSIPVEAVEEHVRRNAGVWK